MDATIDERDADVSTTVVETVADSLGRDPLDLSPRLSEVIDPDALDALLRPLPDGTIPSVSVTFEFHGHSVVVSGDGGLRVGAVED